jgi:hypothetical protein
LGEGAFPEEAVSPEPDSISHTVYLTTDGILQQNRHELTVAGDAAALQEAALHSALQALGARRRKMTQCVRSRERHFAPFHL